MMLMVLQSMSRVLPLEATLPLPCATPPPAWAPSGSSQPGTVEQQSFYFTKNLLFVVSSRPQQPLCQALLVVFFADPTHVCLAGRGTDSTA